MGILYNQNEDENGVKIEVKNEEYFYIWVDSNINSSKTSEYSRCLEKQFPNFAPFTNVRDAIEYFKNIKFHIAYIIVSGSLFVEFIKELDNVINKISGVPKIIIFTSEEIFQKIKNNDKINDSFYNKGGIVLNFKDVESFINQKFFDKEFNFIKRLKRVKMQKGVEFTFELLDNENDFIGALYLPRLFENPKEEECSQFDKFLLDNYGDIMKELIFQIYKVKCPISLRIKYWLRAYTLETKFYKNMNSDLMKENIQYYIPYIKLLYFGLKKNNFDFSYTRNLYRGALIEKKEIENLINHKKYKFSKFPCLIYNKAFMSFSLDKDVAMGFMLSKIPTEKQVRVLYILESGQIIDKNATNADLTDISFFENEKEILLFPFSIYEISAVKKEENYYIINLNILGKYKRKFNYKSRSELIGSIHQSKYFKMLQRSGLISSLTKLEDIVVHFQTTDRTKISWVCKYTDTFLNIEEKLCAQFSFLNNKKILFFFGASVINKNKTLEENRIMDDDVIIIRYYDK